MVSKLTGIYFLGQLISQSVGRLADQPIDREKANSRVIFRLKRLIIYVSES